MSISELKVRLQGVVDRLSQLVERVTEKTELGVFLIAICRVSLVSQNGPLSLVQVQLRSWWAFISFCGVFTA